MSMPVTSSIQEKRESLCGIDLLKFVMAFWVVAIHTKAIDSSDILYSLFSTVRGEAVPMFFLISSFFFFRGKEDLPRKDLILKLRKYESRVALLYFFWFVVLSPKIFIDKGYFSMGFPCGTVSLIHDLFFSYTYSGSWFLSALFIGVFLITLFHIIGKIWLPIVIGILSYCFLNYSQFFPLKVYEYLQSILRPELELTFIMGLPWIVIGYLFSYKIIQQRCSKINAYILILTYLTLYIVSILVDMNVQPVLVSLLFWASYNLKLKQHPIYLWLRKSSILIFFIHFNAIGVAMRLVPWGGQNPLILFLATSIISVMLAYIIIRLSNYKYFTWLKYSF